MILGDLVTMSLSAKQNSPTHRQETLASISRKVLSSALDVCLSIYLSVAIPFDQGNNIVTGDAAAAARRALSPS